MSENDSVKTYDPRGTISVDLVVILSDEIIGYATVTNRPFILYTCERKMAFGEQNYLPHILPVIGGISKKNISRTGTILKDFVTSFSTIVLEIYNIYIEVIRTEEKVSVLKIKKQKILNYCTRTQWMVYPFI
jgi:hypothetical protein